MWIIQLPEENCISNEKHPQTKDSGPGDFTSQKKK